MYIPLMLAAIIMAPKIIIWLSLHQQQIGGCPGVISKARTRITPTALRLATIVKAISTIRPEQIHW